MNENVIQVSGKSEISQIMREIARDLLQQKTVSLVIGWEKGILPNKSAPAFITQSHDTDKLVFDEYCYHNLTKYLLQRKGSGLKTAIFVKGCDSRSLVGLVQDNQVPREDICIIGISCPGLMEERNTVIPAKKCETCYTSIPVEYDFLIDCPDTKTGDDEPGGSFAHRELSKVENMTLDQRDTYWQTMFQGCIRCYACRNVCPVCSCKECCFDLTSPDWVGKGNNTSDNSFYHLVRAMHVAGRCVSCGECERVCPINLPVMLLNSKLSLSIEELFDEPPASMNLDDTATLSQFKPEDPEEFM
ncbi:MAG: 4Fe-4S dicluster domain-containing protein [Peptococcaceae bacterium]|nr:4Fe-4S dicluster domain-containing protein [Peptococcaceae bacterium]